MARTPYQDQEAEATYQQIADLSSKPSAPTSPDNAPVAVDTPLAGVTDMFRPRRSWNKTGLY